MIRNATVDDAEQIARIYNHYVSHTTASFEVAPVSISQMAERLASLIPSYPVFVYENENGEITGYCYAHSWKSYEAYKGTLETTIYLHPDITGNGTGANLMNRLIEECRRRGFHTLIACITAENENSLRFHEHIGFVPVSRFLRVGNKFNRFLDVIDMQLIL